jgi:hypothetical protein
MPLSVNAVEQWLVQVTPRVVVAPPKEQHKEQVVQVVMQETQEQ